MKIFTTLCCATLAICGAIHAQSLAEHITVHFNTPVVAGETKLPAGDCDIQVTHGNAGTIILVLRSHGGPSTAVLASRLSEDDSLEGNGSVILRRRGNDFHLDRILLTDGTGYQLNNAE